MYVSIKSLMSILVRWRDIEALDDGGRFTSSARDQSDGLFAYCQQRLASFKDLAAALMKSSSSLVPGGLGISHAKQLEMFAGSGAQPQGSTFIHTN